MKSEDIILIADDDPINVEMLVDILKDDYTIKVANSGEKALELIKRYMPSIILLDVEMPNMDGYEVCKKLKESKESKNIPVIFVTSRSSDSDEEIGFKLGGVDFITKPFKPTTIKSRVKNHLKLYKQDEILRDFNKSLLSRVESEVANKLRLESKARDQEALLLQQSKLAEMGEMIGVIAHQWKQPISTVSMLIDAIKSVLEEESEEGRTQESAEDIVGYASSIQEQIKFMNETINDFRNFLSPNKKSKSFNLKETIDTTLKIMTHQFKMDSIKVSIDICDEANIFGVENEFKQVLLNLLKNSKDAFKKENKNRKIEISVSKESEKINFKFCDNAGGIPSHLLPDKIFQAYTTTKGEKGTGIGLNISKRIVEEHLDGAMSAYNSIDGACFEIVLPLASLKQTKEIKSK